MNAKSRKGGSISVKDYLSQQIAVSGKSQIEIAKEIGYKHPNIITMFKTGQTKLPLNKIPEMAKALGVDTVHLLRVVMMEYSPQTWEVIESIIGGHLVTENETKILQIVRETAQGIDVAPKTDEDKIDLMTAVAKWRDHEIGLAQAALNR